jgi:ABC-type molybdate transport system substrate-binding protein
MTGVIMCAGAGVTRAQDAAPFTVCHAGSLTAAFTAVEAEFRRLHPAVVLADVSGGSVALASRMVGGAQPCDVYATADHLNIDRLLKPAGLADFSITFASGRMVLAYTATDPLARGIAAASEFDPPRTIPNAAADWYRALLAPGVRVAGSHPFLDPGGYRAHMIFQLAERFYRVPNLATQLLEHYTIVPDVGGADGAKGRTLGTDFSFQFTYEHSAAAAAASDPAYRYVALPDRIDLSKESNDPFYAASAVTMPGISRADGAAPQVAMPAARVAWGVTIPVTSAHRDLAVAFVALLLGPAGRSALATHGPAPIVPASVSAADYARLPRSLQPLVAARR